MTPARTSGQIEARPGPPSPWDRSACRTVRWSGSPGGRGHEATDTERIDRPGGRAGCHEVGEDLADHRRELEAGPGAGRGERDAGRRRVTIDHEDLVGRVRVEADLGVAEPSVTGRHPSAEEVVDARGVRRID